VSILSTVDAARARLIASGIQPDEAGLDAEVLARHLLGWDRATYFTARHREPDDRFATTYGVLVERRAGREPLAHLTGRREFWGLDFLVTPDVLIPRPETEHLVETALRFRPDRAALGLVVDVGTGSGCVAIALAVELPAVRIVATDLSQAALEVAQTNARRLKVADRITWRLGSLLAGLSEAADLIVSNPPYCATTVFSTLEPEVRDHEPRLALDGGGDGTTPLQALVAEAGAHLVDGGRLAVEFGYDQEADFRRVVAAHGLADIEIVRDLQGHPRVGTAVRRGGDR
jgi:release factor glutamine methyltransferase|tara:strand:+ start:621 stop:1484 length:864 start_codon:yes stop_codon:yes gene_type:complete